MSDSSKKVSIRILATSDVHGRFVPYDFAADEESSIGSMTYLSGLIAQHRKENANVILVDCGDSVQANMSELLVVTEEQHPMILAYNYLHYDIWNLGNHEFNFPTKIRKKLADQFQGVTLCGNVFATGASESIFPDITVIEKEGVRVGFIGMVTPMIRVFETGRTNLDGCEVKEPMEVVRHSIQKLRDLGVDCIVGLIHEGIHMENAQPGTSTRELAEAYPEFDVIIGGHEHAALAQELVNGVLITQPKNDAANAAVVDLVFACSEEGTKLIEKSSALDKPECVEDEVLAEKLEYYKETLAQFSRSPVGTLIHGNLGRIPESDPFFRKLNEGSKSVYTAANSVSNLFGTACMYLTGAECVLLHSDNEYAFMSEGELFVKDISGNYQYSTGSIRVYDVNGAFLKKILEWCGAYYETFREGDRKIRFVPERRNTKYCSLFFGLGICYEIDLSQEPGKRIRNLCMIQKDQLRNPV